MIVGSFPGICGYRLQPCSDVQPSPLLRPSAEAAGLREGAGKGGWSRKRGGIFVRQGSEEEGFDEL